MKRPYYIDPIKDVCIVRNGERCKACIYYGKACDKWKREHKNRRPIDYDGLKNDIMSKDPGLDHVYNKNAKMTQRKGEKENGIIKEKRRNKRNYQSRDQNNKS